jgi:hypothetical protein
MQRLRGADSDTVKNAFFANYLAALLMARLHDLKGMQLVRDPGHSKLTKFETGMSDLNFWGRVLFYPTDPQVQKLMAFGHADLLAKESGRILHSRIQKVMHVPLTDPKSIDWAETTASLVVMAHRFELKSSYYGHVVRAMQKWDSLSEAGKRKAVGDSFLYLMQADPKSNLLARMRELAGSTMLNDLKALAMKVVSFRRLGECRLTLNEDGEVVSVSGFGNASMPIFGNTNNIIKPAGVDAGSQYGYQNKSSTQVKGTKGADATDKLIKKRKRKFKAIRFKAPAGFKVKKRTDND